MERECCEKLIVSNSIGIAVKRNVWNLFPLDIQLDVFRCLHAYDLHKKAIYVSSQWRNVLEKHKGTLPKFRQLADCRAQNKLVGDNYEENLRQREDQSRKKVEAKEKYRRIREKWIQTYALLCIISFIAGLISTHPISFDEIFAKFLLLALSLRMGNAFAKFWDDPYKVYYDFYGLATYGGRYNIQILNKWYYTSKLDFFKYVWLAYLVTRTTIFAIVCVLRHLIAEINTLDALLWTLHFPEAAYLMNWAFNGCAFQYRISGSISHYLRFLYRKNIKRLRPDCTHISWDATWLNELPTYINDHKTTEARPSKTNSRHEVIQ
ncbi:hypothetical protein Ddc_18948 [Ditylenchus destructor]|nr:hypothetical protein Ddc_18948 [Ditylenchus destructor]